MNLRVIPLYKPIGYTPLDAIKFFKEKNPSYVNETISYAGRLDPMADGVIVLLVGEENKKRTHYLDLSKKYICDILCGISTDSFDLLGIILQVKPIHVDIKNVEQVLPLFMGKIMQAFPPYSSKVVRGKPLYYWARHKKLENIDIPTKERNIYQIQCKRVQSKMGAEISKQAIEKIMRVKGNFRQKEIIAGWEMFSNNFGTNHFSIATIEVESSSGAYMRQLAVDIGTAVGIPSCVLHIQRTEVGPYVYNPYKKPPRKQPFVLM